jgi:hypothetical protein
MDVSGVPNRVAAVTLRGLREITFQSVAWPKARNPMSASTARLLGLARPVRDLGQDSFTIRLS